MRFHRTASRARFGTILRFSLTTSGVARSRSGRSVIDHADVAWQRAFFLAIAAINEPAVGRCLSWTLPAIIDVASSSIYLIYQPISFIFSFLRAAPLVVACGGIFVKTLFWLVVERPLLGLSFRRRLEMRLTAAYLLLRRSIHRLRIVIISTLSSSGSTLRKSPSLRERHCG